jgi:DNA-binding response OmpR family regulator
MLFVSNDISLIRFQDFLSKKSFKSTFIVFNSSKGDLGKENTKILSFQIPFNLNQLFQALQNIIIQKKDIEYHDIKFKKLFLNMTGKTIGDSKVNTKLTDKESKILWHLVKEKGLSVSHSFLLNKVWGYKDDIETKTLTTHIYTIRKKLNNFNNTFSIENSEDGYCVKFKSN